MRAQTRLALVLVIGLVLFLCSARATYAETHPWDQCLLQHATALDLEPALLHALVYSESMNSPWAIAWTNHTGKRHRVFPASHGEAKMLLARLWRTRQNFDVGLGQVNVKNVARLARPLGFTPTDLLQPCRNLSVASYILSENLERHGYTWKALQGYNGSVGSSRYIELVHTNLCQRHQSVLCLSSNGMPVVPSPSDSLHGTPIARVSTAAIPSNPVRLALPDSPAPGGAPRPVTTAGPAADVSPADAFSHTLPTIKSMVAIGLRILGPFAVLVVLIVLVCFGVQIVCWALRRVLQSVRSLRSRPAHAFPARSPQLPVTRPLRTAA